MSKVEATHNKRVYPSHTLKLNFKLDEDQLMLQTGTLHEFAVIFRKR